MQGRNNKKNKEFAREKFLQKNSAGFLVVEVLVAVSIITASVLVGTAVAQKSIAVSRQAVHTLQATYLLEEGAEAIRIIRDNAWSNITTLTVATDYYMTFSGGMWSLSTTPSTVGIFTRKIVVTNVNRDATTWDIVTSGGANDAGTKLVTLTVYWTEGSQTITKILSFYVSDIFS